MEVVPKPNTMSDGIKAVLDDPQWPEHIKDPQPKQIKHNIIQIHNNGELLRIYNNTWNLSLIIIVVLEFGLKIF